VGNTFLPALSEFYANAHLETTEHSSSSSRIEQPTGRKDVFHIGLRCSGTNRESREGPLACQHSKALTLRVTPASTSAMCVHLRRHTLTASHLVNDDIDTCTMEEAKNLNFCRTNVGGASELQHKIVQMPRLAEISFQSISLEINCMNNNMN